MAETAPKVSGCEGFPVFGQSGHKRRTIGIHFAAAEAVTEYLRVAGI